MSSDGFEIYPMASRSLENEVGFPWDGAVVWSFLAGVLL